MALTPAFTSRNFSTPLFPPLPFLPSNLSWTAFGGPDQATLTCESPQPLDILFSAADLIRCEVKIKDVAGLDVWWGFVNEIIIEFNALHFSISLDELFNRVKVKYSDLSPSGITGTQYTTTPANDSPSQDEYGLKEIVLHKDNVESTFAEALRDTFLEQHAWPFIATQSQKPSQPARVSLHCKGWFHSLSWRGYISNDGFIANHGPGPGDFTFGTNYANVWPSQMFVTANSWKLKHIEVALRRVGSMTRSVVAKLQSHSGGAPLSVLATSGSVNPASINTDHYDWIRFTLATAYTLSAATTYWIKIDTGGTDGAKHLRIKLDYNLNYEPGYARYYDATTTTWKVFPDGEADLYFRLIGIADTGDLLSDVATVGDQFLQSVSSLKSGINISPYRPLGRSCQEEIEELMKLGTSSQNLILATITPQRDLIFYEQPPRDASASAARREVYKPVYLDSYGKFWTEDGIQLPPYMPPVGRWARLAATQRYTHPWDKQRMPSVFIARAQFRPAVPGSPTGYTRIMPLSR